MGELVHGSRMGVGHGELGERRESEDYSSNWSRNHASLPPYLASRDSTLFHPAPPCRSSRRMQESTGETGGEKVGGGRAKVRGRWRERKMKRM